MQSQPIQPLPCKCGSTKLKPKMASETGHKWVHCDTCGRTSTPLITNDRNKIIAAWNQAQKE